MKSAGLGLVASVLLGMVISPANAQRGEQPSPYRGPGGPAMAGPGMSPYRSSPSPSTSYRGATPYGSGQSHSVPSTRFRSIPEQGRPSGVPIQYSPSVQRPSGSSQPYSADPRQAAPPDTSRMQQALRHGDYDRLENESRGVRSRAEELQNMGQDMSVQDRLKLPLIKSMYHQGADMVDEGRSSRDESKVKMGIQQINEANEKLGRMDGGQPSTSREGGNDRSGRGNNGRKERR